MAKAALDGFPGIVDEAIFVEDGFAGAGEGGVGDPDGFVG